jgi:hypothetical protein
LTFIRLETNQILEIVSFVKFVDLAHIEEENILMGNLKFFLMEFSPINIEHQL